MIPLTSRGGEEVDRHGSTIVSLKRIIISYSLQTPTTDSIPNRNLHNPRQIASLVINFSPLAAVVITVSPNERFQRDNRYT